MYFNRLSAVCRGGLRLLRLSRFFYSQTVGDGRRGAVKPYSCDGHLVELRYKITAITVLTAKKRYLPPPCWAVDHPNLRLKCALASPRLDLSAWAWSSAAGPPATCHISLLK